MRWIVMLLFLTAAVAAEGSPREWVLNIDDLKGKLGASYRPDPKKQNLQHGDFVVSAYYVYTYLDSKRGIFMISQVNREISSWDAQVSFVGAKVGFQDSLGDRRSPRTAGAVPCLFGFPPETGACVSAVEWIDESKTVAAGEESRARRSANGKDWMFLFRQRRAWGTVSLNGIALTPREMDALVERYVARVNRVQVRKRVNTKPKGIWRWP